MASAYFRWRVKLAVAQDVLVTIFFVDIAAAYYSLLHAILDTSSAGGKYVQVGDLIKDDVMQNGATVKFRKVQNMKRRNLARIFHSI